MTDRTTEIIDLLRGIRQDVANLAVRVEYIELHLKRQDKEAMEVIAATRRLTMTLEAIDNDEEDFGPLQN